MSIEGFRTLNQDIEIIINKSEHVKRVKKEGENNLNKKVKKELTQEEKEYKIMRKQIQEKLIKFATRIPVFMYLTDYRERSLKDVITQLEPGLFKKVTGLDVNDFELLCSLGVFNSNLMNDAIFKFKRYEDSSLTYTGIDRHADEDVGGWDTVIRKEQYEQLFYNQQKTMLIEVNDSEKQVCTDENVSKKASKTGYTETTKNKTPLKTNAKPIVNSKTVIEMDLTGVVVGAIVHHKTFGDGTIVWIDKAGKHIRVKFSVGEKLFLFPSAFMQGYLTI
jgi:hypothetical protein